MKYSREYERQADLVGAQIMARAGYDPRDLAHMFETIQKQGGNGGPEWLSSHPNPGQPHAVHQRRKRRSCASLRVRAKRDSSRRSSGFASMPPARTMAELERSGGMGGGGGGRSDGGGSVGRVGEAVPAPSRQYRTVQGGQLFTVSVPSNWQPLSSNNSIKYVPQNAYGDYRGADDDDARCRARRGARRHRAISLRRRRR